MQHYLHGGVQPGNQNALYAKGQAELIQNRFKDTFTN